MAPGPYSPDSSDSLHSIQDDPVQRSETPTGLRQLPAQEAGEDSDEIQNVADQYHSLALQQQESHRNPIQTLQHAGRAMSNGASARPEKRNLVPFDRERIIQTISELNFNALLLRAGIYNIFSQRLDHHHPGHQISLSEYNAIHDEIFTIGLTPLNEVLASRNVSQLGKMAVEKRLERAITENLDYELEKRQITIEKPEPIGPQVAKAISPNEDEGRRVRQSQVPQPVRPKSAPRKFISTPPPESTVSADPDHINIKDAGIAPEPQTLSQEIGIATADRLVIEKWGIESMVTQEVLGLDDSITPEDRRGMVAVWFEVVTDENELGSEEREELYEALCSLYQVDGQSKLNQEEYRSSQLVANDNDSQSAESLFSAADGAILLRYGLNAAVEQYLRRQRANLPFVYNNQPVGVHQLIKHLFIQGIDAVYVSSNLRQNGKVHPEDMMVRIELYECLMRVFQLDTEELRFHDVCPSASSLDEAPEPSISLQTRDYDSQQLPALNLPLISDEPDSHSSLPQITDHPADSEESLVAMPTPTLSKLIPPLSEVQADLPAHQSIAAGLGIKPINFINYIEAKFTLHLTGVSFVPDDWSDILVVIFNDIIADAARNGINQVAEPVQENLLMFLATRLGPDNQGLPPVQEARTTVDAIEERRQILKDIPGLKKAIDSLNFSSGEINQAELFTVLCNAVISYRILNPGVDEIGDGRNTSFFVNDVIMLIIDQHIDNSPQSHLRDELIAIGNNSQLVMTEATIRSQLEETSDLYGAEKSHYWEDIIKSGARQLTNYSPAISAKQELQIKMSLVRLIAYAEELITQHPQASEETANAIHGLSADQILETALAQNSSRGSRTLNWMREHAPFIAGGLIVVFAGIAEVTSGMISKIFKPNDGRAPSAGPQVPGMQSLKATSANSNPKPTSVQLPATSKFTIPRRAAVVPTKPRITPKEPTSKTPAPQKLPLVQTDAPKPRKVATVLSPPSSVPEKVQAQKEKIRNLFLDKIPEAKLKLLMSEGVFYATNKGEGVTGHLNELVKLIATQLDKYKSDPRVAKALKDYWNEYYLLAQDWHQQWQLNPGSLPVQKASFVDNPSQPTRHQQMDAELARLNKGFSHNGQKSAYNGPNDIGEGLPVKIKGAISSLFGKAKAVMDLYEEKGTAEIASTFKAAPEQKKGASLDQQKQPLKYAASTPAAPASVTVADFMSDIAHDVKAELAAIGDWRPKNHFKPENPWPKVVVSEDSPVTPWDTSKTVFEHEAERAQETPFNKSLKSGNYEVTPTRLAQAGSKQAMIRNILLKESKTMDQLNKVLEITKTQISEDQIKIEQHGNSVILTLAPEARSQVYGIFKANEEDFQQKYLEKDWPLRNA